jgi:hypothetical protein
MKPTSLKSNINAINSIIDDNIVGKYKMIDGFGYLQKLMDKNEESNFEVVKDTKGNLHYTYFATGANKVNDLANRLARLKNEIDNKKTQVIALMPPDKYIRGYTKFPKGIPYSYANETADNYLKSVKKHEIKTFDFRKKLLKSGIPADQLFYKTDHHWKVQTAFWAYQQLVGYLNQEDNAKLDQHKYYTNLQNYNQITYKHSYLGSMGTKAGPLYAGIDDFTLIYPKFKTDFDFRINDKDYKIHTQGRFEEALINARPFYQKGSDQLFALESNQYFSYLYGNHGLVHITNRQNPDGPKVLFIKDSLSVPLAAFLANVCSNVYLVDPRYYHGSIPNLINRENNLDYVFMSVYPQNLTNEFFPF